MPAGHAILIVVGALVFAMLFNSAAMVHAGEGMPAGTTRDLVLDVAKPVNSFAHALYLDRPRKWLNSLFGNKPAPTGPSALSQLPTQGRQPAARQRRVTPAATARAPVRAVRVRLGEAEGRCRRRSPPSRRCGCRPRPLR